MRQITKGISPEGTFEFQVLVNGKPVREFNHKGEVFIEGRKGTEYSLDFKNNTCQEALIVPSVDGISILDGEPASFDSQGYVVQPYTCLRLNGWRISDEEEAKFVFSSPNGSYVSKKGEDKINLGYIGCAVFFRKVAYLYSIPATYTYTYDTDTWKPQYDVTWNSNSSILRGSTTVNGSSSEIGTAFGGRVRSEVEYTTFNRNEQPECVFTLRYDTKKGLIKRGVNFKKPKKLIGSAFPLEDTEAKLPLNRWCKPPEGWSG